MTLASRDALCPQLTQENYRLVCPSRLSRVPVFIPALGLWTSQAVLKESSLLSYITPNLLPQARQNICHSLCIVSSVSFDFILLCFPHVSFTVPPLPSISVTIYHPLPSPCLLSHASLNSISQHFKESWPPGKVTGP